MNNLETQNIILQLDRLESEYNRIQTRIALIGIPTLVISVAVPLALLTEFVVEVLMPIVGEIIGVIIMTVLFLVCISIVCTLHGKLLNHFFPSGGQKPIIDKFDKAFSNHNKGKREQAIDILDENFDKYSIATLIVGSPSGINRDAYSRLIMDTGKDYLGENEFVFKCDQTLLEKNEIISPSKYENWLEAITTGKCKPETGAQKRFLDVHEGKDVLPSTEPEKIWKSYINIVKWQKKIDAMDDAVLKEYWNSYPYYDKKHKYMVRRKDEK